MFVFFAILYLILFVLAAMWLFAWISMPFKLDRVNNNLEEIKDLLRENTKVKKARKTAGE